MHEPDIFPEFPEPLPPEFVAHFPEPEEERPGLLLRGIAWAIGITAAGVGVAVWLCS